MKFIILLFLIILPLESRSGFKAPDYELRGLTKNSDKCQLTVNLDEQYISFETPKQMCEFPIDDDDIAEFKDPSSRQVTAKGYSNWFDCKIKLSFDERGKPLRAKLNSRLPLAMTFRSEDCYF